MAKLTSDEQRAIIASRLSRSLSTTDSELRSDRKKALDAYYGRPLGNEQDGRSQVVSKDIMDTIEWAMPSLMRVFCTQNAVQFDPVGPEDEPLAKQESEYVRHVLWKKNPGFMLIYNWLKDGLMQKTGYVKYWWQEEEKLCYDEYSGLSDDQLVLTLQELEAHGEVDILGHEQEENGTHRIKLRVKKRYGCAKLDNVEPGEIVVDAACRGDVKKARFVGHLRRNVTRSELIEEGFDRKTVENLTSYNWSQDLSERLARDTINESHDADDNVDKAMQEVELLDCWTYIDVDNDGIAELRHYLLGGNDVLVNEECPEVPLESWTPIPVPHRHSGLSFYDIMEDLQRIKTALQRGLLDNVYFTNAPRLIYDKNTIDVSTLQINRPGGHVANDGPVMGSTMPIPVNPMAQHLLPVIGYFDEVKETRSGIGRMTSGVDADVLAQSTKGAYTDAKSAANQRLEAIARIFAETGYSSLFSSLHRMLSRHQDWSTREKLGENWVEVNPTEWQERANLTVSVGLGNASKDEIRQNLQLMALAQEKAAMVPGLIGPKNVFALFRRMQVELGFENDDFITDPKSPDYQAPAQQPDPYVEGKKVEAQTKMQEHMIDAQFRDRELAQERDLAITEMELKHATDIAKAGIGAEVGLARAANQQSKGGGASAGKPAAPGGV